MRIKEVTTKDKIFRQILLTSPQEMYESNSKEGLEGLKKPTVSTCRKLPCDGGAFYKAKNKGLPPVIGILSPSLSNRQTTH